jgi:NADH-quinone oxidoreductase subunit N
VSSADFQVLLPLTLLALTPIVLLLTISAERRHGLTAGIALVGLAASLLSLPASASLAPRDVTILMHIDGFGLAYAALAVIIAAFTIVTGYQYIASRETNPEEYYVLLLIATAGVAAMSLSTHFVSFYLGLEILSVAQYGLLAYLRRDRFGLEAGLKYLILAAASAAFLLFGMALVYAEIGTMTFAGMVSASPEQMSNNVVLLGVAMMCAAIGFKLSIVPFHYWTPDVYDGAPAPVVAFVSTAGKIGVFAVIIRYFLVPAGPIAEALTTYVAVTAVASMIVGNVTALVQTNIKRLMAYSSIAHMGYLSVAFLAYGPLAARTITFYLIGYALSSLAVFGVVAALSTSSERRNDVDRIEDYRGLLRSRPLLGAVMVAGLLSLAGIPLTAGFLGKVYVVLAGAQESHWFVLAVLALSSVAGAWYYLRVVVAVCSAPASETAARSQVPGVAVPAALVLGVIGLLVVVLGTYPAPVLAFVEALHP